MDAMEFYTLESGHEPWGSVLMNDGSTTLLSASGAVEGMLRSHLAYRHIGITVGHAVCMCCIHAGTTKL